MQWESSFETYHEEDSVVHENQRLFAKTWVNTGSASRITEAGDCVPVSVAGLPLILVRDSEQQVRAFHNVCRHRGARVLRAACQGQRLLRCAYHGWSYGLDGALRGTPHWKTSDQSAPPGFDALDFGLEPVRATVWLDQVFINVDGQAPEFTDFVAPLAERWRNYDLDLLRLGQQRTLTADANWKFAIENYLDTYHLPMVHPQLGDVAAARRFLDVNLDGTVFGICYTTGAVDKPKSSGQQFQRFQRLTDAQRAGQDILALYPNTLIELMPHHMMLVTIEPDGPDRCVEHLNFYFLGEDATNPTLESERQKTAEAWCEIMGQDIAILGDLQATAHSPATARAADMSPAWEQGTAAFRARVASALLDPV
jgi:choline monooxygenase